MKPPAPQKRSVSPFGISLATEERPFPALRDALVSVFESASSEKKDGLHAVEDAIQLPDLLSELANAPANDAPQLDTICQFLLRFQESLRAKGLEDVLFDAMTDVFTRKTEIFMIDHMDRAQCERAGLAAEYKDKALFAKERDALVGRFFAPATQAQPGRFSKFVNRWIESSNPDRLLHFLDFSAGSKDPTFEHYLLFAHPALARVLTNKAQLKALLEKARPVVAKLSSPTWEQDVRKALGL